MLNHWVGRKGESYTDFVQDAAVNDTAFATFRRQPVYRSIVETLTAEQGAAYLDRIDDALVRRLCLSSADADRVGGAQTFLYDGVPLAPTTLRYGKVLCDLSRCFPRFGSFRRIAEIGIGYGGLARLVWEHHRAAGTALETYVGIDLAPVARLAQRYLDASARGTRVTFVGSDEAPRADWDLVVSNYAFSEFSNELQEDYLSRVVERATSGYLTMNSGLWSDEAFGHECLTVEALLHRLPNAVLMPDAPETATENYIVVFGEHGLGAGTPLVDIRQRSRALIAARAARRAERKSLRGLLRRAQNVFSTLSL